jgi:acetyl esterase/lipase
MRVRPLRAAGLVLLVAAVVSAVVYRSWVGAQAKAVVVLVAIEDPPVAGWLVRAVTREPRLEEVTLEGVPAALAVPAGDGPWPAIVFCNGVTERGRAHPTVQRLALALARVGFLTLVPDPQGLPSGELTPRTVAELVAAVGGLSDDPRTRDGRVALVGVSAGTALALIAAQDGALAQKVSVVAGLAPYADLREGARIATTGTFDGPAGRIEWTAKPFLGLVIARSLAAGLEPGADRERLREALLAIDDDDRKPLEVFRSRSLDGLGPEASAIADLFANRRPERFDDLYAALTPRLRSGLRALSPVFGAARIRAPVELVSAPRDDYFPLDDSRAILARVTEGRLTVTDALDHADLRPTPANIGALWRLNAWMVRSLRLAAK